MDEFGDGVWEAQHWENAAEDEESDEESNGVRVSDEESNGEESDDVKAVVLKELKSGRNSDKLANALSLLTELP